MRYVFPFDHPHDLAVDELKALVGGKGANLAVMTQDLGLPVPPGFTISTEACRAFLDGEWPSGLDDEIRANVSRLESLVGRALGDRSDPLLVSVRSGAPMSMPGMMDTILNLGLNDETCGGLVAVTSDEGFVSSCRSRFESSFREIVGTDAVPQDPWLQLHQAIEAVFRSWNGVRARSYRSHEGIADHIGTAVNIQTMVFGNRGPDSGTGVVFTRNPATGEPVLYGDVLFNAQGEDVVAGTHHTESITVLEERLPDVAEELHRYARTLEHHYADVCDIEFTIEQGKLWMLQTRVGKRSPQAALRIAIEMAEDPEFPLTRAEAVARVAPHLVNPPRTADAGAAGLPVIATGLGASPGVASGLVTTSADAAVHRAEAGESVILIRPETSPDDVHGIAKAAGILTSTGGLASHAAVVARGWGIPAIVGAAVVEIDGDSIRIGDVVYGSHHTISVDGGSGQVFDGVIEAEPEIMPEAVKLLEWAEEEAIEIDARAEKANMPTADTPRDSDYLSRDTLLRLLAIKGFATPDALGDIFATTEENVAATVDLLSADGLTEMMGTMYKLSADGQSVAKMLLADDRKTWGPQRAELALDAFVALDGRMKEIVTAWQMRDAEGEVTLNDHTDPEYDASVLARFEEFHREAVGWLEPVTGELERLQHYATRLSSAADKVARGDHQYIASPRCDSYHNVWFELHEDLIRLAGRTREDEVAAGRA